MIDYESNPLHWFNRLGFLVRKELSQRTQREGYDVTFRDRTTVTRLIDEMVPKRFVERGSDPDSRRKSVLNLSAKGAGMENHLVPIAKELIDEAFAGLDPQDIQTTAQTLKRMTADLTPGQDIGRSHNPKQEA